MKLFIAQISSRKFRNNLIFLSLLGASSVAYAQSPACSEVSIASFDKNGELAYESIKTYATNGKVASQKERFIKNEMGTYSSEKRYTYDTRGNIQTVSEYLNDKFRNKRTRLYDAQNKLVSETLITAENSTPVLVYSTAGDVIQLFDTNGNAAGGEQKAFDKDGNLLKHVTVGSDGKPMLIVEKTYNSAGKPLTLQRSDVPANITFRTTYVYDSKGNLIEELTTSNGSLFSKILQEYTITGALAKKTAYNAFGQEDYVISYEYNATGQLTSETFLVRNEVITKRTFTYDTAGNKIRQDDTERGKAVRHIEWVYQCN